MLSNAKIIICRKILSKRLKSIKQLLAHQVSLIKGRIALQIIIRLNWIQGL